MLLLEKFGILNTRADELGFVLLGVYSQNWFASALYQSPDWCNALLDLIGKPSALSEIPPVIRPSLDIQLIGRDSDFDWLITTKNDRVIVGQPGSGKTFLLNKFVQSGNGLFLVSNDLQEIANSIRGSEPKNIIIDDAHVNIELLKSLLHLRQELKANFGIIASCWTGESEVVLHELQIGESATRTLIPLSREQIVMVINETGIVGPDHLC